MQVRKTGAVLAGITALAVGGVFLAPSLRAPTVQDDSTPPASALNNASPSAELPDDRRWTGVAWRQLVGALPLGREPGQDRIDGLVKGNGGLIGWGRNATPGRNQFNSIGSVFLSANGNAWTTVLLDVGVAGPDTSELQHVVAGPAGLIALGGVCCDEERPAAWISGDGLRWERIPYPETMFGAQVNQVIATPTLVIAVGTAADGTAAIWTTVDGRAWNAIDAKKTELGAGGVSGVVAFDTGLLATGWTDTGETYDGAMWTSQDGVDWTRVSVDPVFVGELDTVITKAIPYAAGWWAVGNEGSHEDRIRCEQLVGRVASIDIAPQSPAVVEPNLSCGWGTETVWVSADGSAWERLPVKLGVNIRPPAGELIEFRFVAAGGPGMVALGEGFGESRPSVFASADGRTWTKVTSQPPFAIGQSISGFAVEGRRLVAVGDDWDPNANQAGVPAIWVGEVR